MDKCCDNCRHTVHDYPYPCSDCIAGSKWEQKEEDVSCHTCRYVDKAGNRYCGSCVNFTNWEPKENSVVDKPNHYANQYPFEVKEAIETLLNKFGTDLTPYQSYCLGNEIKYRLRTGS